MSIHFDAWSYIQHMRTCKKMPPSKDFEAWLWEWGIHGIRNTNVTERIPKCVHVGAAPLHQKLGIRWALTTSGKFNVSTVQPSVQKGIERVQRRKFRTQPSDGKSKVGRVREEEKRRRKKNQRLEKSSERRWRCAKKQKNHQTLCFANVLWFRRVEKLAR